MGETRFFREAPFVCTAASQLLFQTSILVGECRFGRFREAPPDSQAGAEAGPGLHPRVPCDTER